MTGNSENRENPAFFSELSDCTLCPRQCHVNRNEGQLGVCGMPAGIYAARAALHMWEEPCISGSRGSGTVFFSGCGLRCGYCQNREIALGTRGTEISVEELSDIFLRLAAEGAANINLVTGAHYVPPIVAALKTAGHRGLKIPVVYNSGGYESLQALQMLEEVVDIYLPDMKYAGSDLAKKLSHAPDYPRQAMTAIAAMAEQSGECVFDSDGYLRRGTVVRHLVLPGHTRNSMEVLRMLWETFGNKIYISIMNQYTPVYSFEEYPELNRRVTKREYEKVLNYAMELGIIHGFYQEGDVARESFIPDFSSLYKKTSHKMEGGRYFRTGAYEKEKYL
ncbi:MAG: radical SAM protein [Clostridiales bacterium]|nr:radical SAM protein [Clostridiales bacterium]